MKLLWINIDYQKRRETKPNRLQNKFLGAETFNNGDTGFWPKLVLFCYKDKKAFIPNNNLSTKCFPRVFVSDVINHST